MKQPWSPGYRTLNVTAKALLCFARLTDIVGNVANARPQNTTLTIHQLMGLIIVAIADTASLDGHFSREAYLKHLIIELYDIQRMYNHLPVAAKDLELVLKQPDAPSCVGGTFNKLIYSLRGFHKGGDITYATPTQAGMKFSRVVINQAYLYCETTLAQSTTFAELDALAKLIAQLEQAQNLAAILSHIKDQVTQEMFAEFAMLYDYKEDNPNWLELLATKELIAAIHTVPAAATAANSTSLVERLEAKKAQLQLCGTFKR